jgi:hypothetical protein
VNFNLRYFASVKIICWNVILNGICKDMLERNVDGLHKLKLNIFDIVYKK